ncbi:ABC transporter ATP-binding protein [Kamptonema cortianum]|nr:ABC transporter ATP-binding protein [Kamptonema cortianum]
MSAKVATNITHDMRNRLFERLQQMSVDFYDRNQVGGLMSRVSNDVEALHEFVVQLTQGFLVNILLILGVGIMLYRLDPLLMMCVLIPAPLVMAATYLFWTRIYPKYFRFWDGNSKLANSLNTAFSGIRLIKAFGQEGREVRRFRENSNYLRETRLTVDQSAGTFFPIFGFCFGIGGLIVWYFGGRQVIDGDITLGTLMAFFGYLGLFYAPLSSLTMLSNWLTRFLTAAQRIFEILDAKPRIVESDQPVTMEKIKGHIVFENVWFGYEPLNPILKDVSFEIKPGEMIGIVGKSGSGKSTLVNLLCRFYDVNQGRVLVDGMDVRQIRRRDLSRNVGLVLQEPFLFRGSVAENIAYGRPDATFEEIMAASKGANCHEFIINLPQGYDTRVGERGAGLSGGERQRISIARALLCDPAILVLDEATSAVDTESERHIQEALNVLTRDRTVIAIAHRLSTLRDANRIFVVDGGRIAESGTHHELLSARGIYHRLVQIQLQMLEEMPS